MNYKVYNPKPFRECAEGLYKPGYSLYFTTWTRDIRMDGPAASQIGEEIISYLHPVPQQKSIAREEEVFSKLPFQEYGFNILLRPQSREIDLYLGYVRLHTYPYSKEQLDSLVGYIGTNKVELGKLNYFTTVDVWGNEETFALGWHPKSIFHSAPVLNYREPLTPPLGVTEVAQWLLDKFPLWEHVSFAYDRPTKVLTFTRNTL